MNRRNFTKWIGAIGIGLCLPKITKAGNQSVPPLPTLKYLHEHNSDISVFTATYTTRGGWEGFVHRIVDDADLSYKDHIAFLFYENNKWIVGNDIFRDDKGKMCYTKQVEWPDWLRKF